MKEIPLTKGYVALVDDEDYPYLSQFKWHAAVETDGGVCAVRNSPSVNGRSKLLYMHRIVLNAPPGKLVDHRNSMPLDNQKHNLRLCTNAQNCKNQGKSKANTSGFCGVFKIKNRFIAKIMSDWKTIYLGCFLTPERAATAYDMAAIACHGEFAKLNYPRERYEVYCDV